LGKYNYYSINSGNFDNRVKIEGIEKYHVLKIKGVKIEVRGLRRAKSRGHLGLQVHTYLP
jgi:hypothetical protein